MVLFREIQRFFSQFIHLFTFFFVFIGRASWTTTYIKIKGWETSDDGKRELSWFLVCGWECVLFSLLCILFVFVRSELCADCRQYKVVVVLYFVHVFILSPSQRDAHKIKSNKGTFIFAPWWNWWNLGTWSNNSTKCYKTYFKFKYCCIIKQKDIVKKINTTYRFGHNFWLKLWSKMK